MHVVILSDMETSGGAAIASSRLAEALMRAGVRVTRIVARADRQEHPWATSVLKIRMREEVLLKTLTLKGVSKSLATYVRAQFASKRLHHLLKELHPDVINVHNLHGAGWLPDLVQVCAQYAPTIWTLHDMWSFTGHCAYSYDCRKFIDGCDALCPIPNEYPALPSNRIAKVWHHRKKLFATNPNLIAITPSNWLAKEALSGLWSGHHVEVIPNGLPLEVYKPIDRNLARTALGVNPSGFVLLTAAQNLIERRKGGAILIESLQKIHNRPLTLITIGHGCFPIAAKGITLYSLGYIDHERTKVLAYNAADLYIHPAPVDNLPNTVMESIACGTPVVGFCIGGLPEMVSSGQTGWLANEMSPEALAEAIDSAIADLHEGVNMQEPCRAVAEAEYSSELQAQRYLELFESL